MSFCVPQFAVIVINAAGFSHLDLVKADYRPLRPCFHPLCSSRFQHVCFSEQIKWWDSTQTDKKKPIWVAVHLEICTHSCCRDVCIFQKPYEKYVWMVKTELYFCIDIYLFVCFELHRVASSRPLDYCVESPHDLKLTAAQCDNRASVLFMLYKYESFCVDSE